MPDGNVEVPAVVSVDCLNVDGYVPGEAVEVPAVSADLLNFVAYFGLVLGAVEEGYASSHCSAGTAAAAVGTAASFHCVANCTAAVLCCAAASFHCTAHCAAAVLCCAAASFHCTSHLVKGPASQIEFLWSACPQLP